MTPRELIERVGKREAVRHAELSAAYGIVPPPSDSARLATLLGRALDVVEAARTLRLFLAKNLVPIDDEHRQAIADHHADLETELDLALSAFDALAASVEEQ